MKEAVDTMPIRMNAFTKMKDFVSRQSLRVAAFTSFGERDTTIDIGCPFGV